jgi:hypothetical protein
MTNRFPILLGALLACACLIIAAVAWAAVSLTIHASFSPDKLGSPTNLSATGRFASSTGAPPPPITQFTAYAPAGMLVDVRGAATCSASRLGESGPSGCPTDSRAGFGGGVALVELAKEVIKEPFTLDFFFAPKEHGRLVLLAYVNAVAPVSVQLVLVARQIPAPKPYGLGVSVTVPLIPTLPEAPDASVESIFVTFGARNVAYYKTIHGKRTLLRVKGVIVPKACPHGGFPIEGKLDFADGTTTAAQSTIPCPAG